MQQPASAKFDAYLSEELLALDYASAHLDPAGALVSLDDLLART